MPSLAPRIDTIETTPSFSGAASFAAGSAAAPSLRFTVDPTTGLYRIGASNIGFATAGVNSGGINSSVWTIGSPSTPTAAGHNVYAFFSELYSATANNVEVLALRNFKASATDNPCLLSFRSTTNDATASMWQIGIKSFSGSNLSTFVFKAQTGPTTFAEVGSIFIGLWTLGSSAGNAINGVFHTANGGFRSVTTLAAAGGIGYMLSKQVFSTNVNQTPSIALCKSNSDTIDTYVATADGTILGAIVAYGVTTAANVFAVTLPAASIYFIQDGVNTGTRIPGKITFRTATTTTEKEVGNVNSASAWQLGAGTTSLVTHTFFCSAANFTTNNGGASNNWTFENSNTGNGGSYIYIKAYKAAGGGSSPSGVILQNIANGATVGTYIRNEGATSSGIYFTTWNAGVEQTSMTSTGAGNWTSNYHFGSTGGFGGVKTAITTTPVSIFPAYTAQTCMVIICGNNAGGTSTTVGVYVLRGYADNSVAWTSTASTAIQLVQQGVGSFTFGVSGSNITIASGGAGNWTCQVLGVGTF